MTETGYAKGRARRRELIEQAMTLFGEVGYRGTSLREIAVRCGISHPGLLHHFPTKEALLLAVLEERDHEDAAFLAEGAPKGVDVFRRVVALVDLNAKRRSIVELFTVISAEATSTENPAHEYFVQRYRNSVKAMTRAYNEANKAGELHGGVVPAAAARQLVALMDGLQIQWLLDGTINMASIVRSHVRTQFRVQV